MDFAAVIFLGGLVIVVIVICCSLLKISIPDVWALPVAAVLFILGGASGIRQLYGKLTTREILRELSDEQFEKVKKQ